MEATPSPSRRRLIVNADDLGADRERNAGILEGVAAGAITSVSLLANGPAFWDAVDRLRCLNGRRPAVGLHLNLSEGRPLVPDHVRLVGSDGAFLGKAAARRLLRAPADERLGREIEGEARAQLSMMLAAGLEVRHLDGHQHVHVFAAVRGIALELARAARIPWVRIPAEAAPEVALPPRLAADGALFSREGSATQSLARSLGLGRQAHFRGLYLKPWLPRPTLAELLARLPPGLTELMVHPGRPAASGAENPFGRFSTPDREVELENLLAPGFRALIAKLGIALVPFPETKRALESSAELGKEQRPVQGENRECGPDLGAQGRLGQFGR